MSDQSPEDQPSGEIEVHSADRIYALKKQGKSLSEIALLEGYSNAAAVSQALAMRFDQQARTITSLEREAILQLELDRLDDLQAAHYESALYGDIRSGQFVLQVMQHRMKLLKMDQPDAETGGQTVLIVGDAESAYVDKLKALADD
jgi:lambda repressor-like predicted transcriptional regulator